MRATSSGKPPPFVSHKTIRCGPPAAAARSVAIEEVFRIVDDKRDSSRQIANTVLDDLEILLQAHPQSVGNMQHPGFAKDGYDRRFCREQRLNAPVLIT